MTFNNAPNKINHVKQNSLGDGLKETPMGNSSNIGGKSSKGGNNKSSLPPGIKKFGGKNPKMRKIIISVLIIVSFLVGGFFYMSAIQEQPEKVGISEAVKQIKNDNAEKVVWREDGVVFIEIKEDADTDYEGKLMTEFPSKSNFIEILQREGIELAEAEFDFETQKITNIDWVGVISVVMLIVIVVIVFFFVKNMQSSGGRLLDFGQSKARLIWGKKTDVGFDDVAGIKESKQELQEVVQFLKNPKKFTKLGARIPKGVLLVGPPGSGKTLLAKAVAGEAGVPFFHTSGSEFEEMLVGAGASRVRDLFQKARKASPCIIFIDEIDAVAKKRGTTLHSGNTEQTLNQILVELDGLEPRVNVIVMAATNRPDVLDPAILRPGRFDRNVMLSLPDVHEREQILDIHAKDKKLAETVDMKNIARRTVGFSGADLENLLNEAAIMAAKNDQKVVTSKDLEQAALKVRYGPEKKSKKRAQEDIKRTAYHEAGHALVAYYTPHSDPVEGVSIISRGLSLGMTMLLPEKDRDIMTRNQMLAKIKVRVGGRVAEEVAFEDIGSGAAKDIEQVSEIARDMVKKYGMSEKLGFVQYGDLDENEYLGYDYDKTNYSEEIAKEIDKEVQDIVGSALNEVRAILKEHQDELEALTDLLLEKEVIDDEEFKAFFEQFKSEGKNNSKDESNSANTSS
jgi:cell division protease FtsH